MRFLRGLAVATLALVILALPVTWLAPQRSGPLGMLRIFYPQLGFLLLPTLPFVWRLRWLFLGAVVALLLGCPPALGQGGDGEGFTVLNWNTRGGEGQLPEADVVALQEADPARLPDSAWYVAPGMALLSRYPLTQRGVLEGEVWDIPRVMHARIEPLDLTVINIHPIPPYTYDGSFHLKTELRDRQLEELRARLLDPLLARGERFLVVGDGNVCEREPGFVALSRGLQDGFRCTGLGWQTTWAPSRLSRRGLGLLRLDYQFASPGVTPLGTSALASSRGSDHFPVRGRFTRSPSSAAGLSASSRER